MASQMYPERNIPHLWDIFGKPREESITKDFQKMKLDGSTMINGNDSAISVGSTSDEDVYTNSTHSHNAPKKKKKGRRDHGLEPEVKYLERHLSMKKTIRKKIMRDLQKAFVEDPNEFRVEDIPPEQMRAEINLQSLSFAPGKKKDKKNNESNFLDFLRTGSGLGDNKGNCGNNKNCRKGYKDLDGDSGHGSPTTEESEEEDKKTRFWKRFTMKGNRNKR